MKRVALVTLLLSACAAGRYDNGDLTLLTAYTAKEFCSCIFVMKQPEDWCRAWTRASPNLASASADARTVTSRALLFWSSRAHFVDDQTGCVLDDEP